MSNLRLVHSAEIVLHPSFTSVGAREAYRKANEGFLNTFPIRRIYDDGSHDVTVNVLTGRDDRLKFIELEEAVRKLAAANSDELCETGTLRVKQFHLNWEIICLDKFYNIVSDPVKNPQMVYERRLQLRRSFVSQLNDVV